MLQAVRQLALYTILKKTSFTWGLSQAPKKNGSREQENGDETSIIFKNGARACHLHDGDSISG